MSDDSVRDRLWRRVEGVIDAFQDTDREVLPENAWRFILYFAKQAKGPFILLLIVGGLAGAVDAGPQQPVWREDYDHFAPRAAVRGAVHRDCR